MRGTWKIAALLAGAATLGIVGCATDIESPAEETTPAVMAQDVDVQEEITDDGTAPEALMSVDPADEATGEVALDQFGRRRPPLCRHGAHLVRVPGGWECRGGGPFASRPFCPSGWRLIHQGRGWVCERGFGPPHRPLTPEPAGQ